MHIALIGAGLMGAGMGANLLRGGHRLSVIAHRNRGPIEALVKQGAREAGNLADMAEADIIILCLTTAEVVEATIATLSPRMRPGQIIIDAGTTAPETTRRLAAAFAARGIGYADAPMTGGPLQAAQAELGALVGASPETFAAIQPVLACYASTIRHLGPPGAGHTAKLISNYLVTGMIALVADAFGAARSEGIDAAALYAVMLNGSGNSGVLQKMMGAALQGNPDGYQFGIGNAAKDIGYYGDLARAAGIESGLARAIAQVFARALEAGHAARTVSRLLEPAIHAETRC